MDKNVVKRLSGLGILAVVAILTFVLHSAGEARKPATYTVTFSSGIEMVDQADQVLDRALEDALLRHQSRIIITGHTGTRGDPEANQALSEKRARVVARSLIDSGIDEDRIETLGMGGSAPLDRVADESDRAFQRRLPRTEITIAP